MMRFITTHMRMGLLGRRSKLCTLLKLTSICIFIAWWMLQGNSALSWDTLPFGESDDYFVQRRGMNNDYDEILPSDIVEMKGEPRDQVHIMTILCQTGFYRSKMGRNCTGNKGCSLERQLLQVEVQIKSALALSKRQIMYHVIADDPEMMNELIVRTKKWPEHYTGRLSFKYYPVIYPKEHRRMRAVFRECATLKLFLLNILERNVDAAILVDTDIVYMGDVGALYDKFKQFTPKEIAGFAPCLSKYGTRRNKIPFYGESGVNAGMILFNFTRLHNFPGGWENTTLQIFQDYKSKIVTAEQDVINILFHQYPELLHDITCDWNFRPQICVVNSKKCLLAENSGARLIHGSGLGFFSMTEAKFKAFFDAWNEYTLGESLLDLGKRLQQELPSLQSRCKNGTRIDIALSNTLITGNFSGTPY